MASIIRISILADAANAVRGLRGTGAEANRTQRQLAALQRQVGRLEAQRVNIDVKTRGFGQAVTEIVTANLILDRIRKGLPDLSFGLTGVAEKFTLIAGAALAATAAALPLVGATVAIGAALGAAAAGVGLFAAVAAPTFKAVTAAVGEYNTASHAYDRAKSIGDTKAMAKAQDAMASSLGALSPLQRAAAIQTINMNKAWGKLSDSVAPTVLTLISHAAATLSQIIPKLSPAVSAMAKAFSGVSDKAFTGLSKSVTPFANFVKNQGAPAFKSIGTIIGNLLVVVGHIATAFAPLGNIILAKLGPLTAGLRKINFDGLAKSAATFLPAISTLLKNVGGAFGNIVKAAAPLAGPVLKMLGDIAASLKTALGGPEMKIFAANIAKIVPAIAPIVAVLVPVFVQFAAIISGQVLPLIPKLLPIVKQLADVFINVVTGLSPLLPSLLGLIGVLVSFIPVLYPIIIAFRDAMIPVVRAVSAVLIQLRPSFAVIVAAVISLFKPLTILLVALVKLVPVLVTALLPAFLIIVGVISQVVTALAPLFPVFGKLIATVASALMPVIVALSKALPLIVTALQPLFPVLDQVIQALADGLQPVFTTIGDMLPQIVSALGQLVGPLLSILTAVLPIIPPIGQLVSALIGALLPAVVELTPALVDIANAIAKALPDVLSILIPIISGLTSLVSNPAFLKFTSNVKVLTFALKASAAMFTFLWDVAKSVIKFFADHWRQIYKIIVDPILLIINYVASNWDMIRSTIVNGFIAIVDFFRGLPARFIAAGQAIMQGLADGIQAGLQWVRDKVAGLADLLPGWLKSILGIHSSSTAAAADAGTAIVTSMADGMTSQIPHLKRTLTGVGSVIADGLSVSPALNLTKLSSKVAASISTGVKAAAPSGRTPVIPLGASGVALAPIVVNITVAPGGDLAEAGRQAVAHIEAYERQTGRRRLMTVVPVTR